MASAWAKATPKQDHQRDVHSDALEQSDKGVYPASEGSSDTV